MCGDALAVVQHGKVNALERECTQVRGAAHIGPVGIGTEHLNVKLELAVDGREGQQLTWVQTGPGGVLRVEGYRFVPETVACEAFAGGFTMRATGATHIRPGPRDTREAGEEVLVEERLGVTTIAIGGRAPAGAVAGLPPPLELPASRWGPALTLEGPSGTLNHNSLHAS